MKKIQNKENDELRKDLQKSTIKKVRKRSKMVFKMKVKEDGQRNKLSNWEIETVVWINVWQTSAQHAESANNMRKGK